MKPEAQRIAIAEACGLKQPFTIQCEWEEKGGPDGYDGWYDVLRDTENTAVPHYLSDLNAMHEVELCAVYPTGKGMVYLNTLSAVVEREGPIEVRGVTLARWGSSATAAQRAEAFLRTIGKWEAS